MSNQNATRYEVVANMMGGLAKGAHVRCVVSLGPDPYSTTDRAEAERTAEMCRALADACGGYRNVVVREVSDHEDTD